MTCSPPPISKDKNEFCRQWADEGMCIENAEYMRRNCQRSCAGKPGVPAPAPICGAAGAGEAREIPEVMSLEELVVLVNELTSGQLVNASSSEVSVELLDD